MLKTRVFYFFILIKVSSCTSTAEVFFQDVVDTSDKEIQFQEKKIFSFDKSGVYFSNDFDGARLNNVIQKNDSTFILSVLPENTPINPSPFYAFKVISNKTKRINLEFDYPNGYNHRYIPKIYFENKWSIADTLSFIETNNKSILKVVVGNKSKIISGQELNSSSIVYEWVEELIKDKRDFVSFNKIGKTKLKRPFMVIDINKNEAKQKPTIVLITRQHPPEVTGYFAFQSFLSSILEESDLSSKFLNRYRILAFPMMNPDGVDLGHWRHNSGGVDLNRDWSAYNQKEIKTTVDFISKTLRKNKSNLILGLDFHSTYYDVFYTNIERSSTSMPLFLDEWFLSLENSIPSYKVNEQPSISKQPVSKGWFLNAHKAVGVVYEIGDNTPRDRIKVIGRESARSMMKIMLKGSGR
jgi:murein tripeptide amidase MpaA